jgi:AraC-like DNA-binding protein
VDLAQDAHPKRISIGRDWRKRGAKNAQAPTASAAILKGVNLAAAQVDPVRITVRRPGLPPGLAVARFTGGVNLSRSVPEHCATTLHLEGRSEWSRGRERWSTAAGAIGLKIPGEVYAERARLGRSHFQVLIFDDALIDSARTALNRPLAPPAENALDSGDPRVRALAALHRQLLGGEATLSALEQQLCDALAAFVELTSAPREARCQRSAWSTAVARARALLNERLTETVTLDELAAHARLDKYRLCRAFRDEIGLPPHAYVTHRRVSRAQELLARGLPQAEVAASVGIYDQSQLHRHFKRILGLTPGAFARAVR